MSRHDELGVAKYLEREIELLYEIRNFVQMNLHTIPRLARVSPKNPTD
jgi:hypothetical protein